MDKKKINLIIEVVLFIIVLCIITFVYYFTGEKTKTDELPSDVGIIAVNDDNFEEEVLNSDKPVVLEFSSNMCPPCLLMVSTMINIAKNNENIKVVTINTSENNTSEVSKKYNVEATPTILIIENGEIQKTFIGVTSEKSIQDELDGGLNEV